MRQNAQTLYQTGGQAVDVTDSLEFLKNIDEVNTLKTTEFLQTSPDPMKVSMDFDKVNQDLDEETQLRVTDINHTNQTDEVVIEEIQ